VAISHAVLALLTDGPCHGYQLRAAFEQAVGPQWGGLNIGHLYQVLDRLARDGQVSSSLVPQSDRPDRRVYALTDAGRAELERWLAEPVERTGGYRDDLMLKLLAAARGGEDDVIGVLDRQRRHELLRLKSLDQLARQHRDAPLVALLVEAATLHTKADLALLDRAEARAAALAESAVSTNAEPGEASDVTSPRATSA
jgi:DNA-binding PadR family transcriptional regulator